MIVFMILNNWDYFGNQIMVAQEGPNEPRATKNGLLVKQRSFQMSPLFLYYNIVMIIIRMNQHNFVTGLLSVITCCYQCRCYIFYESEADPNNNVRNFFRHKDNFRLFCEECVSGRLGHPLVFETTRCELCEHQARLPRCVCRMDDFRRYEIRVDKVRVRNAECVR